MAERRDYIALEWVAGEIAETLNQAVAALEGFLQERADTTRLRFCLTYIHQVHGSLRMVEFTGAALLAEELEAAAQALLQGRVAELAREDALAALLAGLRFLPDYIQRLQSERQNRPAAVLGLVNDLRAVRGEPLITESAVFNPVLGVPAEAAAAALPEGELLALAKKLRQMYQMALLNYLRGEQPRDNLNYLAKICARLDKLAAGRPGAALWRILIALCEGLLNRSVQPTAAVKWLLRQVDGQLKALAEQGYALFDREPPPALVKNLLYYIAVSGASSRFIAEIRARHFLAQALPPEQPTGLQAALAAELAALATRLEQPAEDGAAPLVLSVKHACDAAALLGLSHTQGVLQGLAAQLARGTADTGAAAQQLWRLAAELGEAAEPAAPKALFNDSAEAQEQLDTAFEAVLRESRNGLEQAKDAVIEFVANQWQRQYLEEVPKLLAVVRGSLALAAMPRAAVVLGACEQYVQRELLGSTGVPAWQLLDTLADAIASVDYYLERVSEDRDADCDSVLDIAEESVARLGYGVAAAAAEPAPPVAEPEPPLLPVAAGEPPLLADIEPLDITVPTLDQTAGSQPPETAAEPVPEEAPASVVEEEEAGEAADPEIVEIFIEEAGEVLATIGEVFPAWRDDLGDGDRLAVLRRAFHTLKGSGRMVGAVAIGELAWSIENMLNRLLDGGLAADAARAETVAAATALVPAMVEAFQRRQTGLPAEAQAVIERAGALAREQNPPLPAAAAPVEAAAAAPEQPAADAGDEELAAGEVEERDNVLLDIFASEAISHIEALEQFLRQAHQLAVPAELSDDLQRALHTLKGSAHMADVAPVAQVVTPVERLVKELRAAQLKTDPEVIAILEQAALLFRAGLAHLADDAHQPLPGSDDFVRDVEALHHARLALVGDDAEGAESVSPAAIGHFLGDAIELISAVADDLLLWSAQRLDGARQSTLAATVSQIADSAEAVNLGPVVELAQPLQTLLRLGAEHGTPPPPVFFAQGLAATEALIDMLDRLAAGQKPEVDEPLIGALQDFTFPEPEPAFDEQSLAEEPVEDDWALWSVSDAEAELEAADGLAGEHRHEPFGEPPLLTDSVVDAAADGVDSTAADPPPAEPWAPLSEPPLLAMESFAEDDLPVVGDELAEPEDEPVPAATIELVAAGEVEAEAEIGAELDLDAAAAALALETAPVDIAQAEEPVVDADQLEPLELMAKALAQAAEEAGEPPPDEEAPLLDVEALESEEVIDLDAAFAAPAVLPDREGEPSRTPTPLPPLPEREPSGDSGDEIDAEILEIFLEEAGDLLEAIEEAVHNWGSARGEGRYLDDLQRLLHTLKGGARLAGLKNLGNLSHNFETLLINAQQQGQPVDDAFLGEVQSYQDQLVRLVDAVRVNGAELGDGTFTQLLTPDSGTSAADAETLDPAALDADDVISGFIDELAASETDRPADDAPRAEPFARPAVRADVVPFMVPVRGEPGAGGEREELPDAGMGAQLRRAPQEAVRISAQLLEQLVNLAGETSIARSRTQEQVSEFGFSLDEMQITVDRLQEQVRRLDLETEAQMLFRQEQVGSEGMEGFDPLEFDRYSLLQQLSRSLLESASDLIDIKNTLSEKSRDMETLLVQQSRINTELQEGLMRSRMVPFARMVPRLRRIVRQISGELRKEVEFFVDNAEGELDRTVLERIVAPLEHMLRNAVDHGIESADERAEAGKPARGTIRLRLGREGGEVVLTLTDDGRGVDLEAVRAKAIDRGLMAPTASLSDHEILQFILEAGFSTARQVTQISGRGVGMDVVHSEIKQLGGSLDISSQWGQGTRFTVRLPFTVSVNRALMVNVAGDTYAIPLNSIEGIVRVSPFELEAYYQPDAPLFEYAGQPYTMRYMGALLRLGEKPNLEGQALPLPVLLVRGSDHSVAVQVDGLMGSREIVVKTLGPQFAMVQGLSGATVLGDGSVVVILDLLAMIRADALQLHRDLALQSREEVLPDRSRPLLVMVVDDSVTVRKVTSRFLERQGMEVMLAKDGVDAINLLTESERVPDVMLLDIEMPRMDGFEVASRVRHTSRLQGMPIIMITSRTGEKHRERAFSLGVNRYLGKPYQEMVLLDTIYELTGAPVPV